MGAGGMGEACRARDATVKRDVAIKVLPEFWSPDPERMHRFEQLSTSTDSWIRGRGAASRAPPMQAIPA